MQKSKFRRGKPKQLSMPPTDMMGPYLRDCTPGTAPIVFNQRFEPGTLGSESQCSCTAPSWNLYVESGDNVVNAKGRANEIGQSLCQADLFDFQLPTTGTNQKPPIDPMQTHVA